MVCISETDLIVITITITVIITGTKAGVRYGEMLFRSAR
jgi:hypothetical protein